MSVVQNASFSKKRPVLMDLLGSWLSLALDGWDIFCVFRQLRIYFFYNVVGKIFFFEGTRKRVSELKCQVPSNESLKWHITCALHFSALSSQLVNRPLEVIEYKVIGRLREPLGMTTITPRSVFSSLHSPFFLAPYPSLSRLGRIAGVLLTSELHR